MSGSWVCSRNVEEMWKSSELGCGHELNCINTVRYNPLGSKDLRTMMELMERIHQEPIFDPGCVYK